MTDQNTIVIFNNNNIGTVDRQHFENSLTNIGLTLEQVNAMQLNSDAFIAKVGTEAINYAKANNLCNGEGDGVQVPDIYMGDLQTGNVVISSTGNTVVGITTHSGEAMQLLNAQMESFWASCNATDGNSE